MLRHLHDHTPEVLARIIIVTAAAESTCAGCKEIGRTRTLIRKPIDLELRCSESMACHDAGAAVRNA